MNSWILALAIFCFTGCSGAGPLAPTTTDANSTLTAATEVIDWQATAPGCDPRRPITEPTGPRTRELRDGRLILYYRGSEDTLFAIFHEVMHNRWALCFWDRSDN